MLILPVQTDEKHWQDPSWTLAALQSTTAISQKTQLMLQASQKETRWPKLNSCYSTGVHAGSDAYKWQEMNIQKGK